MRKLRPDKLTEVLQVVSDSLALATELHCRELLSISPELTEFCFCVLKFCFFTPTLKGFVGSQFPDKGLNPHPWQ